MNIRPILYSLLIVLTGCGIETNEPVEKFDADNAGKWSGEWVERNDNFTVNYDPGVIDGPLLENIERVWLEVQTCIGIPTVAGLVIEYTPTNEIQTGYRGYIIYGEKYIRIREFDTELDDATLRHEFVHWILKQAGTSSEDLTGHNSDFYSECD